MTDANQTSSRSQGVGFLGVSRSLTTNKNQYKYENQKTKQASQDRRARGECVYRNLEHHRRRHTASGHNYRWIPMNTKPNLQIGQAYIVDNKPMVLIGISQGRYAFTDGRYGFGRTLGRRESDSKILDNLKIAEGVNPKYIIDKLSESVQSMVQFYRNKSWTKN